MIRCLVVDDEPLAVEVLRKFIVEHPQLELVQAFTRPLDAFGYLQNNGVDILFLDIQMPELTGVELAKIIRNAPAIVFTTAFREYALDGFDLQALDYLVKPIAKERFEKTIQKYIRQQPSVAPDDPAIYDSIFVNVDKKQVKLQLDDILYIEALKNYVRIVTVSKCVVTHHALSLMAEKLPSDNFLRIHRSYIVNLRKVDSFSSDSVEVGSAKLPLGDSFREAFLSRMKH